MDLDKYHQDFERTATALPRQFARWSDLPEFVRDGFFEELIGMLARRSSAERLALAQGRVDAARKLAALHGRLVLAVAEGGRVADISPADLLIDMGDVALVCSDSQSDHSQAA